MSLAKTLTKDQIAQIQAWADEGDGLSEIQSKLGAEMDAKVTYLETRFLLEDIGVELKKEPVPEPEPEPEDAEPREAVAEEAADGDNGSAADPVGEGPVDDSVDITISKLQRPGALISGTVAFAGNQSAKWWLDQMGQLGFEPENEGFSPSPEQMMAFQKGLQAKIQESGM